ncbi:MULTISPECIES: PQQ-dependent sugar dehydrogenase [Rhodococcus]|jgi:glucose/arabinose dehydrogenase|uniref:PQQ-dependent sugar dehydrogenase n=1 Tax=Rhodococcus oxybenzonivorans TaxID=1990687 RepID=A0AAE5A541_9NOCA|nr:MULTISPECIES: PQQ-dependent sugar dehydrogenase [Rhodococcus]MDV7244756.1 PQQ-dependent sugar dehydrogenase [Rhodococcus oxybenzonivorans]MDV7264126.1 PQQ-dependent sugar dehydrogenase [Rhodococcus oxybenzonivorans]MDV7275745.1 PQQ-dependent sugar dehydrogenase [Rhodococcus oxybenzonivorans]MDV7332522.1 PQQ-dependent sugar dehydrogenase [Rhodococcus oxybenzonivorans]MDV7346318.1 PQQ-dependent sugar dehydrogenase [Rhodococcus oxybenzonivorans]
MMVGGLSRRATGRSTWMVSVLCVTALLAAGCAKFDDSASSPFSPEPSEASGAEVEPESPPPSTTTPPPPSGPLGPCQDPDPSVIATCLDTTGGLVVLPDAATALVAERRTGRILEVAQGRQPREIAHIDVDASSDGGLLDIALSPSFVEDNLIYAYISTPTDNRVVRVAPGDTAKEVLGGIPRGNVGNAGSLEFSGDELMVLTGNAGNPAAASDPASLAGKLLKVTALSPAPTPAQPRPQVVLSGIGTAGGVCVDPGVAVWVTDRTPLEDRLQRVSADGAVSSPVWTWPERPGVGGCVAAQDVVAVSLSTAKAMSALAADPSTGAVTTAPGVIVQDRYGQLGGAALGPDGLIWVSTVNKTAGQPGPNDDRVIKMPLPSGGGGFD